MAKASDVNSGHPKAAEELRAKAIRLRGEAERLDALASECDRLSPDADEIMWRLIYMYHSPQPL